MSSELFKSTVDKKIMTWISLSGFVLSLVLGLIQLLSNEIIEFAVNIVIALFCLVIFILYKKNQHGAAFWLLFLMLPTIFTINTYFFGNLNNQLYLISGGILATFLSRKKKYWSDIVWVLCIFFFLANLFILYQNGEFNLNSFEIVPFFANGFLAIATVYMSANIFKNEQEKQRQKLEENNILKDEQKQKLAEANASKEKLITMLSHDFRSPLNYIRGLISLFESGDISSNELGAYMKKLGGEVDKTSLLMDNTLYWIKSQFKETTPNKKSFNLKQITLDAIEILSAQVDKKKLQIKEELNDVMVITDYNMLSIVVRNLVANAIKFTEAKTGYINLKTTTNNGWVSLIISDNGKGMQASELQQLFIEKRTNLGTQGEQGFGLGLSLVKSYADLLDIELKVESEIGKGTTFTLNIPSTHKE
jgi:signal transduction histidine kinase